MIFCKEVIINFKLLIKIMNKNEAKFLKNSNNLKNITPTRKISYSIIFLKVLLSKKTEINLKKTMIF